MPDALPLKGYDPQRVAASSASASPKDAATMTSRSGSSPLRERDKKSLDYVLRTGLAGGAAGCAAKTLIAPLDRVKILFQASNPQFAKYTGSWLGVAQAMKDIRQNEGILGLFRGHSATLLRIFPYAAVKFVAYEQIRSVFIKTKQQETAGRRFLSGSLAGITSVFCTYPLEVIRVRLAFDTRKDHRSSLRAICRQIYHEPHTYPLVNGLSNFYRGFSPTLLGMLPYAGVSFLMHDNAGDWLRHPTLAPYTVAEYRENKKPVLTWWAQLVAGGFAGLTSQTASYPLEVIRRRMQVGGARGETKFAGIGETAVKIWREKGTRGFFVGLTIGYVKVVPMAAASFFVYERCKLYLGV